MLATFWNHPEHRIKLLESSRKLSWKLFEKHVQRAATDQPPEGEAPQARAAGQQQGRMAVAALGERWIEQQAKGSDMDYTALVRYVVHPEPDLWNRQLTLAGDQISQHWRRIPETISQRRDQALKPDTPLAAALTDLTAADQLCRQIDGALVDTRD